MKILSSVRFGNPLSVTPDAITNMFRGHEVGGHYSSQEEADADTYSAVEEARKELDKLTDDWIEELRIEKGLNPKTGKKPTQLRKLGGGRKKS